jgi:CCR4-NOT transcription complex subunit 6
MYGYPQQSPGIAHKLPNHHDQSPWTRSHHPVLGPPGSQPPNVGPPPPSPGYAIYTNGNVNPMQHHPAHHPHPLTAHPPMQHHHHHQNSLTRYPTPPNGHSLQQHVLTSGSPANGAGQIITPHWQQQLLKCEVCHFICVAFVENPFLTTLYR